VLDLISSVLSPLTGWKERLQNDMFCYQQTAMESWNVQPAVESVFAPGSTKTNSVNLEWLDS